MSSQIFDSMNMEEKKQEEKSARVFGARGAPGGNAITSQWRHPSAFTAASAPKNVFILMDSSGSIMDSHASKHESDENSQL